MAVVQNPIIGRARNNVGNVIFQSWKGKNVLRSRPLTVANPRTEGQVNQRNKMTLIVAIYRYIAAAIKLGFNQQAVGKSEYNAFVSDAIKNAISIVSNVATLVPTLLKVAKGTITPTTVETILRESGGLVTFEVSFDASTLLPGQSNTDSLNAVLYNATADEWKTMIGLQVRDGSGSAQDLPSGWLDTDEYHAYTFFNNPKTRKSEDSFYTVPSA